LNWFTRIGLGIIFLIPWITFSQDHMSVRILPWRYGKAGAVSVSFDDGDLLQYEVAAPILESLHMRGSFGVVGEWTAETPRYTAEEGMFEIMRMGWREIRDLAARGHEIAAHGYRHRPYGRHLPAIRTAKDMRQIRRLIERQTGRPVYTLHYPYSRASDSIRRAAALAGYRFARASHHMKYNTYEDFRPYHLASIPILNDTTPSLDSLQKLTEGARGRWLILMYHHLFPRGSKEMRIMQYHRVRHTYSVFPATFRRHMEILSRSGLWVAPEYEVGSYMTERLHTHPQIRISRCRLIIDLKTELDTTAYRIPLTLEVRLPWKKFRIMGAKAYKTGPRKGHIQLEAVPGSRIIIRKKGFLCWF